MLMHPYNIDWTHQKLLQITLQSYYQQDAGLHLDTDIHIAALMLLTTGYRTEETQCTYSELRAYLIGVALDKVNIFTCRLHRIGAIVCPTLQRYTIFWKHPNES